MAVGFWFWSVSSGQAFSWAGMKWVVLPGLGVGHVLLLQRLLERVVRLRPSDRGGEFNLACQFTICYFFTVL